MPYLQLRNLGLSYVRGGEQYPALEGVNLSLDEGEICAVVGPSGSGKSTLLSILSGVLETYEGELSLAGQRLNARTQQIALVPQHYGLMPWKSVRSNIALPQQLGRRSLSPRELDEVVASLGLGEFLERYPHELSGGQRQRVALARAFGMKPDLLLLDEAFSALDVVSAERSRALFRELWERYPCTTIVVTHSPSEALELASRVVLLSGKPGRVQAQLEAPSEDELRSKLREAYAHDTY